MKLLSRSWFRVVVRGMTYALVMAILVTACSAGITQVVLFTGFGAGPGPNTGMDLLSSRLTAAGIPDYLGEVFEWTQYEEAAAWVQQHSIERSTLVLIGHSFGGNSALQLASNYLSSLTVDLTVQIDPVKNFFAGANDVLPSNVEVGFNYYQISTGFLEPQGEDFVAGATNFNTELLFNDTSITHTSIDDDPRLHARIAQNIFANLNPASADFNRDGKIDGRDFLVWQRGASPDALSVTDLQLWQGRYGTSEVVGVVAVPEPNSFGFVMIYMWISACRTRSARLRLAPPRG